LGKLKGKIALITGGNSGIGLATAKQFVAEGAYVYTTGRRQKELDAAVAEIGKNVTAVQGDVANMADLDRLFVKIEREKGRADIVFANAAVATPLPLGQISKEQFDRIFDVNVRGLLFTEQRALPLLPDGSSILLCGASGATRGIAGLSVYTASKAAVRAFARSWSVELQQRRIRVNVLSPGPTETPIFDKAGIDPDRVNAMKASLAPSIPAGRLADPDEIAKAAVFLASNDSSFVFGADIAVDGGHAQI
jgi:NAD(P)-dependent dehydrogenase (short-subunit alcohol dehydrogenase family)